MSVRVIGNVGNWDWLLFIQNIRKYFFGILIFEQRIKDVNKKNILSKEESICKGFEVVVMFEVEVVNLRNSKRVEWRE